MFVATCDTAQKTNTGRHGAWGSHCGLGPVPPMNPRPSTEEVKPLLQSPARPESQPLSLVLPGLSAQANRLPALKPRLDHIPPLSKVSSGSQGPPRRVPSPAQVCEVHPLSLSILNPPASYPGFSTVPPSAVPQQHPPLTLLPTSRDAFQGGLRYSANLLKTRLSSGRSADTAEVGEMWAVEKTNSML